MAWALRRITKRRRTGVDSSSSSFNHLRLSFLSRREDKRRPCTKVKPLIVGRRSSRTPFTSVVRATLPVLAHARVLAPAPASARQAHFSRGLRRLLKRTAGGRPPRHNRCPAPHRRFKGCLITGSLQEQQNRLYQPGILYTPPLSDIINSPRRGRRAKSPSHAAHGGPAGCETLVETAYDT